MKRIFFAIAFIILFVNEIFSQFVINEILYAPSDASNEWFEIYNRENSPVIIQNWKWKDATSTLRTITVLNISIPAQSYFVVCQDSVKFKSQFSGYTGIIFETSWSSLNNSGDNLILINPSNSRIDSLTYQTTWGGNSGGRSLERINPAGSSTNSLNWGSSVSSYLATPGLQNSITPKPFDLNLKSFKITPAFPHPGDTLLFNAVIKNSGLNTAETYSICMYLDADKDSIAANNELINFQSYTSLATADSVVYENEVIIHDTGTVQFIALINFEADEDTINNIAIRKIKIRNINTGIAGILINEIMYSPSSSETEWIEIHNGTQEPVDLSNWKIADSSSQSNPLTIISFEKMIAPDDYIVIAKNISVVSSHPLLDTQKVIIMSSFPVLNNDRDRIIFYDKDEVVIDSISYISGWGGNNGHSLERRSAGDPFDSTGWATSVDCEHSSPAKINSVVTSINYAQHDLVINEIMFDPFTDKAEWIEFYNPGIKQVVVTGWNLNDASNSYDLADTCNFTVAPGEYFVLSKDTSIYLQFPVLRNSENISFDNRISLSNEEEPLSLSDLFNTVIDSVLYKNSWHSSNMSDVRGISLERINPLFGSNNPANWSSSAAISGGTPGSLNSIYTPDIPTVSGITILPNPFSPDGDGFEDFTMIKFRLDSRVSQLRMKVFDIKGRMVRELLNNFYSASEGSVIFDGYGDDDQRLRVGVYIIFLEAVDDRGGTVSYSKAPVVVAGKL